MNMFIFSPCATSNRKKPKKVIEQILELEEMGCEIIRVSCMDQNDALAIKEIQKAIHIPLVADIHFDYRLALACIEAGADKIRLNQETSDPKKM